MVMNKLKGVHVFSVEADDWSGSCPQDRLSTPDKFPLLKAIQSRLALPPPFLFKLEQKSNDVGPEYV